MRQFLKTMALFGLLLMSNVGAAQYVSSQSISYSPQPVMECNTTGALVTVQKLCNNIALVNATANIGADTTTIIIDYSLGPICLGAIAMVTESVSIGQIPSSCTTIEVICNLNSSQVHVGYFPISVGACCQISSNFSVSPSRTICLGDSAEFENTSTGSPTAFRWYDGTTLVSTSTDYSALYSQTGQYQVSLVAYNSTCSDSTTKTITVIDPSVDLGADTAVCLSAGYVLDAGANRDSVMWSTGETTNSIVVNSPGTYGVLAYTNQCLATDSIVITGLADPVLDLGQDTIICIGDTLHFDVTQSGTATYMWNDGSTSPMYSVSGPGLYYVMVTSVDGCVARDSIEVTLDSCYTSLLEQELDLSVYPNPTSGVIQIESDAFGTETKLEVVSITGQRVAEFRLELGVRSQSVDLSELEVGVYLLRITNESGAATRRIILE
ncbi:MAG: T9SS type A sorting domain-containing protein [Flavobacteriia bacterium]|nr:T9SS type A sorting domain-containing protein [Flavobacteriia bacterium]